MKKLAYAMTVLMAGCLAAMLFYYNSNVTSDIHIINQNSYGVVKADSRETAESQPAAVESTVESIAESIVESVPETTESTESADESTAESSSVESPIGSADFTPKRIIFIGDARTIAMYDAAKNDEDFDIRFVSTTGADLNWLNRNAFDTEYQYINSETAVVIMLGVSDMHRAEEYVRVLNEWGEVFKRDFATHFYFDSVNPVDPGVFTNDQVETFNEIVKSGLSENVTYIDTYSALTEMGYSTTDTLHYTDETTKNLYDLFMVYFNWKNLE